MKNKLAYHPNHIAKGFTIILTLEYNFLHFLEDMIIQSLMQDSAELNLSTNKKLHLGGVIFSLYIPPVQNRLPIYNGLFENLPLNVNGFQIHKFSFGL